MQPRSSSLPPPEEGSQALQPRAAGVGSTFAPGTRPHLEVGRCRVRLAALRALQRGVGHLMHLRVPAHQVCGQVCGQ